jgi:hypothetical protein
LCHARDSLPQCVMLLSKKRVYLISRHRPYVQCLCAVGGGRKGRQPFLIIFVWMMCNRKRDRPNNKERFYGTELMTRRILRTKSKKLSRKHFIVIVIWLKQVRIQCLFVITTMAEIGGADAI